MPRIMLYGAVFVLGVAVMLAVTLPRSADADLVTPENTGQVALATTPVYEPLDVVGETLVNAPEEGGEIASSYVLCAHDCADEFLGKLGDALQSGDGTDLLSFLATLGGNVDLSQEQVPAFIDLVHADMRGRESFEGSTFAGLTGFLTDELKLEVGKALFQSASPKVRAESIGIILAAKGHESDVAEILDTILTQESNPDVLAAALSSLPDFSQGEAGNRLRNTLSGLAGDPWRPVAVRKSALVAWANVDPAAPQLDQTISRYANSADRQEQLAAIDALDVVVRRAGTSREQDGQERQVLEALANDTAADRNVRIRALTVLDQYYDQ